MLVASHIANKLRAFDWRSSPSSLDMVKCRQRTLSTICRLQGQQPQHRTTQFARREPCAAGHHRISIYMDNDCVLPLSLGNWCLVKTASNLWKNNHSAMDCDMFRILYTGQFVAHALIHGKTVSWTFHASVRLEPHEQRAAAPLLT